MKKVIALLVALAICEALCACGNRQKTLEEADHKIPALAAPEEKVEEDDDEERRSPQTEKAEKELGFELGIAGPVGFLPFKFQFYTPPPRRF